MRFRFRKYDEEKQIYKYITSIEVEDYHKMFKTLTFMTEHKCEYCIELNTTDVVDTLGENYEVGGVALCISNSFGEDALEPVFVVDLI